MIDEYKRKAGMTESVHVCSIEYQAYRDQRVRRKPSDLHTVNVLIERWVRALSSKRRVVSVRRSYVNENRDEFSYR